MENGLDLAAEKFCLVRHKWWKKEERLVETDWSLIKRMYRVFFCYNYFSGKITISFLSLKTNKNLLGIYNKIDVEGAI